MHVWYLMDVYCINKPLVQLYDHLRYATGSYSHTTVPSRLSIRLLSDTLALTPDDSVMLPVTSFIFTNSSLRVISKDLGWPGRSWSCHVAVGKAYHSLFAIAVVIQVSA